MLVRIVVHHLDDPLQNRYRRNLRELLAQQPRGDVPHTRSGVSRDSQNHTEDRPRVTSLVADWVDQFYVGSGPLLLRLMF